MTSSRVASAAAPAGERLAIGAERALRAAGDARTDRPSDELERVERLMASAA
jgi:hypothetical protein